MALCTTSLQILDFPSFFLMLRWGAQQKKNKYIQYMAVHIAQPKMTTTVNVTAVATPLSRESTHTPARTMKNEALLIAPPPPPYVAYWSRHIKEIIQIRDLSV